MVQPGEWRDAAFEIWKNRLNAAFDNSRTSHLAVEVALAQTVLVVCIAAMESPEALMACVALSKEGWPETFNELQGLAHGFLSTLSIERVS